jgi:predicted nucleotidyltransferase
MVREQLIRTLKAGLPALLQDYPVAAAYLYGSFAEGTSLPFSDVDIALVLSSESMAPRERLRLQLQLAVELAEAGVAEADVRIVNQAPLMMRGQVACQGILVYSGDETARVEFETRTREEYFDFRPLARQLREAYFADLRQRGIHGQRSES